MLNNLLNSLLESDTSNAMINQMAQKVGLDASSITQIVKTVAPALTQKANDNFKGENDSGNLLDMIKQTDLDALAQNPNDLEDTDRGNALLGELTGSKEGSRSLASEVGSQLGIDASSITKLLPMVAPLVAGMLNKQVDAQNLANGDTNSLTSMLTSFIDQDNDGSIIDDLASMAGKFLKS